MAPGLTNARPLATQNKCPTPGTNKVGNCLAVARGGGGVGGSAQLELTDALLSHRGKRRAYSTHYTLGSAEFRTE